ncbi:SGNH/GDSL hydrolase family protein [Geminisphaera colitermitum]|uniref:SGNH/GDSL hydrolase family protein n=1 Tax=Geminisphaera colitermitum TaxID=1148786 RepID=UPI000158C634|nr:SGNH/GDSL hydrolase family protein [Geminisphaera colitermitum]
MKIKSLLFFSCFSLLAGTAFAAPPASSPMLEKLEAQVVEHPGLPRVLILGDSISIGYTQRARKRLEGVAVVRRPTVNCGSTQTGLENIDQWLGGKHWDVIHFNWGLHDLRYRNPRKQSTIDGLKQNVPPAEYEKNLRELVAKIKAASDTQIFATTTPIPEKQKQTEIRIQTDVDRYNEIALRVMREAGVLVNDLNAVAKGREAELMPPNDIHFSPAGYEVLADAVASSIKKVIPPKTGTQ